MMDLVADLRIRGHEVLPVSISRRVSMPPWFNARHGEWLDLHHLDWDLVYTNPRNVWEATQRLHKVVENFKPQIIHSHLWSASLVAALATHHQSTVHISHLHNHEPWKISKALKQRVRRTISRHLFQRRKTQYIACSADVGTYESNSMGVPSHLIHVARNAVDTNLYCPVPTPANHSRIHIGTAGNHIHQKNHALLINAIAELLSEGHDIELTIAGNGPLTANYIHQIHQLGIADRVHIPGSLTDMVSFYRSLDFFALPSVHEGLPLVVLEAMSCGKCIVASNLPGMDEPVQENVNGILFENNNRNSLVDSLRKLVTNRQLVESMGKESRRIILQDYSPHSFVDRVESIYDGIVATR